MGKELTRDRIKEVCETLGIDKDYEGRLLQILYKAEENILEKMREVIANKHGEGQENLRLVERHLEGVRKFIKNSRLEQKYGGSNVELFDEDGWSITGYIKAETTKLYGRVIGEKVTIDWEKICKYAEKTNNQPLIAYLVANKLGTKES